MKKSLSVLLAVILLVSCISVGFTGMSMVSAEGVSCTVTTEVEPQNGLKGGYIKSQASQTAASGGKVTLEAVPYYGNSFAGWYDGDTLVSTNAKFDYTVTKDVELKAKFNIYNLIEDGNFATSEVGDTAPKAMANIQFGDNSYKPTFEVMSNSTLGTNVLKYTSTASQNGKTGARKDIVFPFTVKKNTKYVFRYSFQNDLPLHCGFAIKTANAWSNHATVTYSMAVTEHGTGIFYNNSGWSYDYKANATAKDNFDLMRYNAAVDNSGNIVSTWYNVEVIFDSLENEGTLYFCLGVAEKQCAITYLANLQLSELTELPVNGGSQQVESGSFTVNRDPYISEEYKMVSSPANYNNSKTPTYFSTVYTLADAVTPTTATAVPADGCALEAWYDKDGQQLTTNTTLSNYKTGDTPKFVKELDYEGGGIISDNGDGTFTAMPFYGNRLIGWYKNGQLVSSETVIKKADYIGAVAKFTTENMLTDGDFETGYSETANIYNSYPNYSPANRGTATVVENQYGSEHYFGSKVLAIKPNSSTSAGKNKALINIPVELEANTQYLWKFSYYCEAPNLSAYQRLQLSVDKEYGKNTSEQIPWSYTGSANHVTYSLHSQISGNEYEALEDYPILGGQFVSPENTAKWSWSASADGASYLHTQNANAVNKWVDIYVVINAKMSGNFFLTLGTCSDTMDTFYFDNMSLSKVFGDSEMLTTAAVSTADGENGGKVYSYLTERPSFEAKLGYGGTPIINDGTNNGSIDPTKPLYAKMSYTYYAVPDEGYIFNGWYVGNNKVSSNKVLTVCGYDGKQYVAKFKLDPDKYTAKVVVDNQNGIYGGYITSETTFTELNNSQPITVSAVAYSGNEFLGWYDGDECVSKETTATIKIAKNTTLTAKFECNNLIADSGYENTPAGTAVIGNDWSSTKTDAYGTLATDAAATGKKSISISSINHAFRYRNIAIEQNKTYHLGLNWMTSYAHSDASPIGLDYVAVKSSADGSVIAEYNPTEDVAALGKGKWQKATVNFNSSNAESVYFEIKYNGDIGLFYIDDIVLYDTEAAPFTITADIEKQEEIFPGYIKGEKTQTANYGESVTVTAVPYERNVFLGWYKDSVKVSESAEYTFTADEFASLTAKFEVHNLVPDSGFEHTPTGVSLSDLGQWEVDEGQKSLWQFDVMAYNLVDTLVTADVDGNKFTLGAYDGEVALKARHRSPTFTTSISGLKENTYYIFSFKWMLDKQANNEGALHTAKLTGVQQNEELGAGRGVGIGAASTDQYQTVTIPFFSGQNTEIKVELGYESHNGNKTDACLYIDNMSLYESDYITIVQSEGGKIETTFNGGQSGPAEKGQLIELTAVPDAGHTFVGWYDYTNPNKCLGTDTTYSFNADGALAITARWEGANAEPVNYFIDGDFENNCIIPPYFDHPFSGTEWCKYGITTSAGTLLPASGKQFLTLTANSRYTNFLISNLEPSTTYTVSFWYSSDAANEFTNIYMFERYGEYEHTDRDNKSTDMKVSPVRNYSKTDTYQYSVGSFMPNSINNAGKWQRGEFTFTTTNRREVYMHIENGGTGSFYFDDIKIVKGNTGGYTEEIVNGDFETPTAENGWYGDSFVTATEGTNTYGVTALNLVQGVNLRETTAYTLTFKARAPIGAELSYGITKGGATALTDANGNSNAISGAAKNTVTLTNQWQTYTLSFTSQGYLQNNIVFSANSEIHINDVTLSKATGLANAARVDFETADQQTIGTNTLVTIGQYTSSNTYENGTYGSGNYAGKGYNDSFYEVVDTVSHTGSHSLVMRRNAISAVTDTSVNEKWTDSNGTVHEGTYALADPNSGFISHPLHQSWTRFKLRAGKAYTLTYYAKADKATEFKSMMVSIKSDWHYVEMAADEIKVGTDWTKVTQTFTMIDSMTTKNSMAFFVINGLNGKTDSDIYIDDIEIAETASSVIEEKETNLYTQDISQNYLTNFSFEKTEGTLGAYSTAASDAVYGEKIGSFKAGDKVIIPVSTRVDYNIEWASEYTFAASVRANSGAEGFVGLSYSPDGSDRLASIENGKAVNLLSDTKGKWVRSGYTFSDFRLSTVYLVIECTKGSFQLDYLSLFNDNHGFDSFQNDHSITTFDPSDESNFVDMNTVGKGNHISGVLTGLPSGSKVVLKGAKTYESKVDSDGKWGFEKLDAGTYNMYVYAADASAATLWGDITFSDEGVSGLACERLNGEVIAIEGEGVRNGIVKVVDDDTEWAYLTTTDSDGQYTAYILDSNWYIAGTTNIAEALKTYNVTLEQFN